MATVPHGTFTSFGALLRYLRRRAQLSQRDLAIAVGYSESQISRLEQNQRKPDLSAVLALLVPALELEQEPELVARLVELAAAARDQAPEIGSFPHAEQHPSRSGEDAATPEALADTSAAAWPRFALPAQTTPCIGRADEIAALCGLVAQPDRRLITIVGPGGIGKTRVALEVAAASAARFPHGAHAVLLTAVPSVELVGPSIAEALKLTFYAGADALLHLRTYLRDKALLLLLDDMDHLVAGAEVLVDLLAAAPGLKLLVTSRERLRVRGEWLFDMPGLAVPPPAAIEDFDRYSAVQLFQIHAQRLALDFAPTDEDKQNIARICRFLGGKPLAIELAAGWVRLMSCENILRELTRNLDLLHTTLRDMPERHRTMRAVFDQSWALLTAEEQRVLRCLSVFRGGFGHAAARAVADVSLPILAALVDKSLLYRSAADRYDMHELLRHYAAEQRAMQHDLCEQTQDRHCHYYAGLLQEWMAEVRKGDQQAVAAAIGLEIDNLRVSWGRAVRQVNAVEIDRLLGGLFWFYAMHGWYQEGEAAFSRALARLEGSAGAQGAANALLRGRLLVRCGRFSYQLSRDIRETKNVLTSGLALLIEHNAAEEIAQAHKFLGDFTRSIGAYQEAVRHYQESLSRYAALGDEEGVASAFVRLGLTAWDHGEYTEAAWFFREGLAIYKADGNRASIANALSFLGSIALETGAYDEAVRYASESLAQSQALGMRWGIARALNTLGNVAKVRRAYLQARDYYQESLTICRAINDCWAIARVQTGLGAVTAALGDWDEGVRLCQESLALSRAICDRWGIVYTLAALGTIAAAQGDDQAAKAHFQAALSRAIDIQSLALVGEILVGLASLLAREEQPARAGRLLAVALNLPAVQPHIRERALQLADDLALQTALPCLTPAQAHEELNALKELPAIGGQSLIGGAQVSVA
jgi:predicted ATPase/transcriptional regulator with XRE-family HTH domain